MSRIDFRVEDLLAAGTSLILLAVAGWAGFLRSFDVASQNFWDLSYMIFPVVLLLFLISLQYAFGPSNESVSSPFTRAFRVLRDWLPFMLMLLTYEAFQSRLLGSLFRQDRDAELLRWDRFLFRETPAVWLQDIQKPWITGVMTVFYFLHLVMPPLLALLLYSSRRNDFRRFLFAILITAGLGLIGYAMVPAVGPGLAFPELFRRTLVSSVQGLTQIMDVARAPRDAFPSLHVAISVVGLLFARKLERPWWFFTFGFAAVGNWVSTLYLRYHYLVDVFAGVAVAFCAVGLADLLLRIERNVKRRAGSGADVTAAA